MTPVPVHQLPADRRWSPGLLQRRYSTTAASYEESLPYVKQRAGPLKKEGRDHSQRWLWSLLLC
jgi:hypothetical protein